MLEVEDCPVIYDSFLALLANIEGEKQKEVTPFYIKDNIHNNSTKRLKSLASVLIDSICEQTIEKNNLEEVQNLEIELATLILYISKIKEQVAMLKSDNLNMESQLKKVNASEGNEIK